MTKSKRFASSNSSVIWWFLLGIILIGIFTWYILGDEVNSMLFLGIVLLPFVPIPFLIKSYYIVSNGRVLRYHTGGKNKTSNFQINLAVVRRLVVVKKSSTSTKFTFFGDHPKVAMATLNLKNADEFLSLVQAENPEIIISDGITKH